MKLMWYALMILVCHNSATCVYWYVGKRNLSRDPLKFLTERQKLVISTLISIICKSTRILNISFFLNPHLIYTHVVVYYYFKSSVFEKVAGLNNFLFLQTSLIGSIRIILHSIIEVNK